MKSLKFVGGL
jgi:hypothetical protein